MPHINIRILAVCRILVKFNGPAGAATAAAASSEKAGEEFLCNPYFYMVNLFASYFTYLSQRFTFIFASQ